MGVHDSRVSSPASTSIRTSGTYTACKPFRCFVKFKPSNNGKPCKESMYAFAVGRQVTTISPMLAWMISMRGFADCSFTTFAKNLAPSSAAVQAPKTA